MGLRKSWDLGNGIVCDEAYLKVSSVAWTGQYDVGEPKDIIGAELEVYSTQEARNDGLRPIARAVVRFPLDNTDNRSWVVQAYEYVKTLNPLVSGSVDVL